MLAFVDRRNIYVMETSQDHKPVDDGDTGPMTGGMGAYSPTPGHHRRGPAHRRARHPGPDRGRPGARRDRVQGRPLRRPDAHAQRPQGAGVQLPLRRPRDPAADDAAQERPAGGHAGRRRGPARSGRAEVGRAARPVRRRHQQGLPRPLPHRPADHRHRERRLRCPT